MSSLPGLMRSMSSVMVSSWSPFPAWMVDGAQVVGAAVGIVAVLFAVYAIVSTDRGLIRERRIEHELEVLRGLASVNALASHTDVVVTLNKALKLLPNLTDFPLTRVAVSLPGTQDAERRYVEMYPNVPRVTHNELYHDRLLPLIIDGRYEAEWTAAVERRVGTRMKR